MAKSKRGRARKKAKDSNLPIVLFVVGLVSVSRSKPFKIMYFQKNTTKCITVKLNSKRSNLNLSFLKIITVL